jgi:hypothetical protein
MTKTRPYLEKAMILVGRTTAAETNTERTVNTPPAAASGLARARRRPARCDKVAYATVSS